MLFFLFKLLYWFFIFIFFIYLIIFILRLLSPFILRYMMRRMKNKFEKNIMKEQEKKSKNYGDTVVEFDEEKEEKKKDFGGEYVDYEELNKK